MLNKKRTYEDACIEDAVSSARAVGLSLDGRRSKKACLESAGNTWNGTIGTLVANTAAKTSDNGTSNDGRDNGGTGDDGALDNDYTGDSDSAYASSVSEYSTVPHVTDERVCSGQSFESIPGCDPHPVEPRYIQAGQEIYKFPQPEADGKGISGFWKALDLGLGNASWAVAVAQKYRKMAKVKGIYESNQLSEPLPGNFKEVLDKLELAPTDMKEETYDLIHVRAVAGFIHDCSAFYKSLYSILRPGGRLIHREHVLRWGMDIWAPGWYDFEQERQRWLNSRGEVITPKNMKDHMREAGFQKVEGQIDPIPAVAFTGSVQCRVAEVGFGLGWNNDKIDEVGDRMPKEAEALRDIGLYHW
ncbi:methyltransferasedomain-containing protein [Cordyceps javanica]|uniref:Methyltransferasedomain-containing protein n=1 Tax=Cordyceps javanica TaxID=43265 RepID=A0A545ULA3_9HYPO|nr:methyltransferasedomain-containing protein [Cordyceps javanica]TQW01555.1 methyltransferase domain-containing protein [Cordyceps javanica]